MTAGLGVRQRLQPGQGQQDRELLDVPAAGRWLLEEDRARLRVHRPRLPLWQLDGARQESPLLAKRRVQEHPDCFRASAKTPIAISGDDDGVHYIMFPKSEDPENWEYDIQVMVDTEATTAGTMAVVDLDGDGFTEIISAGYTAGEVYVFTFNQNF